MENGGVLIKKIDHNHYEINSIKINLIDETDDEIPMVSVTMITYNHQDFIAQAIEGVMMQQVDFKFVLVIGEDCGTDQTRKIILDYQKRYSNKIILKLPEKNLGIMENSISNKMFCKGKYIAECEGDDYWTDPFKLQRQVDFLEGNSDYVMCYHDCNVINESDKILKSSLIGSYKNDYEEVALKHGAWIPTLTRCFRNVIKLYPEVYSKIYCGDLFLTSLLGNYGKAKYLDFIGASYREHSGGVWSKTNEMLKMKRMISDYILFCKFYKNQDKETFQFYKNSLYKSFSTDFNANKSFQNSLKNLEKFKQYYIGFLLQGIAKKIKKIF